MHYKLIYISLLWLFANTLLIAQPTHVIVDDVGIMRWPDQSEVQGFGVNYTVPFAHAYRTAKKMGVDPKEAIDNDVYHFARLGFDAYRVHVWDTEISDTLGNLITNKNLELFDYMIHQMKGRGMKFILTPIAFWGNGWPEKDEDTPGFSNKYGKEDCLTNAEAILAQERYLAQFLNHVNPYTGLAYKSDPDIVAFEVSNEPHHDQSYDEVKAYIKRMVESMKNTGCQKPILYNVSHSIELVDAYYDAGIDGGTFQWYPTGLGSNEEVGGNLLPNVDAYDIPFKDHKGFKKGAKIVYEFDAADVGRSYIYPAMARSFRTAGIQWATHFSYDPTFMAYANTEYDTHFMNLVYAPQKALSLKIASEVFHKVPMYEDYGHYPDNAVFDDFTVNYKNDLAEYEGDGKFFYTNHTETVPIEIDNLKEIAGFGNSSIVQYEGLGAYFLDEIEKGVWRLEVMPDAIWTKNLFGENSLDQTIAVINWRSWPMQINLTDLGQEFDIKGINSGNETDAKAINSSFDIAPGAYLISKKGRQLKTDPASRWKNITLNEFTATPTTLKTTEVLHQPVEQLVAARAYMIKATIVTQSVPGKVVVDFQGKSYLMQKVSGYDYAVTIPKEIMQVGEYSYKIRVSTQDKLYTSSMTKSGQVDFLSTYISKNYQVNVVPTNSPLFLFEAAEDFEELNMVWKEGVKKTYASDSSASLNVTFDSIPQDESSSEPHYALRFYFGDKIQGRASELNRFNALVIKGNSLTGDGVPLEIALITDDAEIYGGIIQMDQNEGDFRINLKDLAKTELVTLPRPYPSFLSYFSEREEQSKKLDLSTIESIQISIGPGLTNAQLKQKYEWQIQSIRLE